jgi:hypothetical protein
MTDKTEQFDNNSQDFSDEAVRRFLLGRLDVTEQTTFEEHFFTDERLEARVRLAEFDLADDYALARLSPADRVAFEEKFLLSAGRKRKLKVSTALRDRFASASTEVTTAPKVAKASISERLRLLFGFNQRAWRFAFGAAALVVLIAAAWLVLKESRIKRAINQPAIAKSSPSPGSKRDTQHPPGPASPPEHHTTPSPMPPHEPAKSSVGQEPPAIVGIFLMPMPNLPPNDFWVPEVKLPKNERDILRLQLSVEADDSTYQAEILTIDGRVVFRADSLKPTQAAAAARVAIDIPAGALRTGQYEVRLTRVNGFEPGTTKYYFRVR